MKGVQVYLSVFSVWSVVSSGLSHEMHPVVDTDLGKIVGSPMTSNSGRRFHAFRGIRFAEPPVGELRFKDPVPIEPWDGVYDATNDGPVCPQQGFNQTEMDEDCLRLNVYTPNLPSHKNRGRLVPVVVYFHPGGFYSMSGMSKSFGPEYLMNRDVVLVGVNHRLGALGFTSTGTKEAPGNAGLKDQVVALKWIKNHIARFGGDPNSVTLMGLSAGGWSITLHMMSPMSQDLFHKAIVMSGTATPLTEAPPHQLDLAKKQAGLLNCSDNDVKAMLDCMRSKPYMDFVDTFWSMFEIGGFPILLWRPVVEPDFGQERFLTEEPMIAYQEGRFKKVPVIAGITKDEFAGVAIDILSSDPFRERLNREYEDLFPLILSYERGTERSRNITEELKNFYVPEVPLTLNGSLDGMVKLVVDPLGVGVNRFVRWSAKLTTVYYYLFSYQGRYSYLNYPDGVPFGVSHHDDLLYLFTVPNIAPEFNEDDPEYQMMEKRTRMVEAFAYKDNPNDPKDKYLQEVNWEPFTLQKESYLDIGDQLVMKENLYSDRYAVWSRLFSFQEIPQH